MSDYNDWARMRHARPVRLAGQPHANLGCVNLGQARCTGRLQLVIAPENTPMGISRPRWNRPDVLEMPTQEPVATEYDSLVRPAVPIPAAHRQCHTFLQKWQFPDPPVTVPDIIRTARRQRPEHGRK